MCLVTRQHCHIMERMQRWIFVVIAILGVALLGGGYGYWHMRKNRPDSRWVPIPLNTKISGETKIRLISELETELKSPAVLRQLNKDLQLQQKWHLSNEDAVFSELNRRIFVREGSFSNPVTGLSYQTIDIGATGVSKETELLESVALSLHNHARSLSHKDK